jgi:myo-inositol-1(or 4)-monophosphatase
VNLKPWDTAAGALLVQEAGGTVTALGGAAFSCHSGNVLASNGRLHETLRNIILNVKVVAFGREAWRRATT